MKVEGRIGYDSTQDRMRLLQSDLWTGEGFHCGETLEVYLNGEYQQVRMEYNDEKGWYFYGTEISQANMEGLSIRCEERN